MAFTEFYIQSGGSNLNSGSTNSNSATYTSTGGNWTNATRVFTPTDGSTPSSSVNVGDCASVYVTAGATATNFIGRVTAVGAGVNGTITISSTFAGSNPSNGTGTMTIKVGGAWAGPGGAVTFPVGLASVGNLVNTSNNRVRINLKNDQTYTMTSQLSFGTSTSSTVIQGYSTTVGDGGKAHFTSNLTTTNFAQAAGTQTTYIDLDFANTGASNSGHVFSFSASSAAMFIRCVFHGGRGSGLDYSGGLLCFALESEAYDNNKSNTANCGGFSCSAGHLICYGTYSHDNTGSNSSGFVENVSGGSLVLFNCISESNGGIGALTASQASLVSIGTDYYNNASDAIKFSSANPWHYSYLANNNFLKNGGKGVNNTLAGQPGIIYNNGRGSGTQANGSSDALGSIADGGTDVTYASGVTPWNAPTTGDFSTVLAAAMGAGRGHFEETDGTNSGTVGYPDIGAAQALVSSKSSHVFCG